MKRFLTFPRLSLLFLALFAAAASAFLAYIYVATAGEATRRTDQEITREMRSLAAAYQRAGVDALDREIVVLLRRRFDYMEAAARIKPERAAVRDEARKRQVIAQAAAAAEAAGLPAPAIAAMWETLVEASIAYELEKYDARDVTPR